MSFSPDLLGRRLWRRLAPTLAPAVISVLAATPVAALQDPSALCERAAAEASVREGVPLSVLSAISLNETGRKSGGRFRAWPWTVNMEGKGYWFETPGEALAFVQKEFARGARSFDVGCFQINYKWHGQNFASIEEMFDPLKNALYAGRFLRALHQEHGSWEKAAGAYHSRTPEFADRYAARFARFRSQLIGEGQDEIPEIPDIVLAAYGGSDPAVEAAPRVNAYPFLQSGGGAGLGSLVPIANGSGTGLFGGSGAGVIE